MIELQSQLWINIIFQFCYNLVEILTPFIVQSFKKTDLDIKDFSSIHDASLDPVDDLTEEYLEIVIQLTMLQTFGQSFPLSAFLLWLSFKFELRLDLWKFITFNKRGLCNSTKGIGVWNSIMKLICLIAINNNIIMVILEMNNFDNRVQDLLNEPPILRPFV